MSSEARNKWKKRKREPQINKRRKQQQHEEEDDDDENEDELDHDDDYDLHPNPNPNNPNSNHSSIPLRETEVLSDSGVRISDFPPVVKHTVSRPHSMVMGIVAAELAVQSGESGRNSQQNVMVLENVSYGQLQALSAVPADSPVFVAGDQERGDGGSAAAFVLAPPPIMDGRGVVKRFDNGRVLVVPMHSDWFSPNTVHRLERQVVPQYFSGKLADHTPEKYMECRNRIVAKYMENPEKRLLISDCQGLVVGMTFDDVSRIVRFLDHWGIINYCAAAVPNYDPWNGESYLTEDLNGEVHVPSDTLKSIDSLLKFEKPRCRLKPADVSSSLSCNSDDMSDLDSRIRERLSENRCNHCSRPISIMHYQSQKEVDVLLCLECFHEGRFVAGHSSIDYVRVDSTKDYGDVDGESWTDQETLLLLEAVEIYSDSWNDIAEHVGSKSKAQCIHHFIRLPMEDGLLENIEVPTIPISSVVSNGDTGARSHPNSNGYLAGPYLHDTNADNRLPFGDSANPVMALVAFLTATVGPRVAAACAHASLAVLSEDSGHAASGYTTQQEGSDHGNRMNSESLHSREGSSRGDIMNSSLLNGSRGQSGADIAPLSVEKVKVAAKAGLAAAAVKAKSFADHEEREIQRLSANIINHQLKRLELKLKQFAELETLLMKECDQVEKMRQRLAAERVRTLSTRFGPTGISSPVNVQGIAPAMVNNNAINNRQQVISASPAQPNISGYSNNQPGHPHMQFMPRQQMFGFGPRLPLTAIQPSSSSVPSNAMFNPPGNSQPTLRNPMLRPV